MATTDDLIDALVLMLPYDTSLKDRVAYREILESLVKMARMEQMMAINEDLQSVKQIAQRYRRWT
jgi:hypothetical protein